MSANLNAIQQIKDKISCFHYATQVLGLPLARPGDRCKSFRPGSKNPTSLLVDDRSWVDFGAAGPEGNGLRGDVIDLAAHARHGGNQHAARAELASLANLPPETGLPSSGMDKSLQEAAFAFHEALTAEDREYLSKRKITPATIDTLKIGRGIPWPDVPGMENRIVLPYWQAGQVRYLVGRGENPKYKKLYRGDGKDHPIWGLDSLTRRGRVVIAEGAFDALSVWQEGFAVLSAITGRFSADQERDLFSVLAGRSVVVAMDYDPMSKAGQAFTIALARKLFLRGIPTNILLLDGGNRKVDLSDIYSAGDDIREMLLTGENFSTWEIERLSHIEDGKDRNTELKRLLHEVNKSHPWPDVVEMLHAAKKRKKWDKEWLTAVKAEIKAPPSDEMIVRELEETHHMIYHGPVGWYVYDECGVWRRREDNEIEQLIEPILGKHKSGPRLSSAHRVARAKFTRPDPLEPPREFFNFTNGMLRLSTFELLPHSPMYYSTVQVEYAWNPSAECPNWRQALNEITDEAHERVLLLQEMFGYCLLPDCRFERGFILMGDGANGKSTILEMLRSMLGKENTSNVTLSALPESFERIRLLHKMANISTETTSKVKGAEEILKTIISGETVSASYKHRNAIEFDPYATCIFATNSLQESEDTTYGFLRKICFIKFDVQFKSKPRLAHERKKRVNTDNFLKPELPGVLRWAIAGLQRLLKQGDFTDTLDHRKVMAEFISLSNPVASWLEDQPKQLRQRYHRIVLYTDYCQWCSDCKRYPLSRQKFYSRLRSTARIVERRSHNGDDIEFMELPEIDYAVEV